jgi:peroxiredoxin
VLIVAGVAAGALVLGGRRPAAAAEQPSARPAVPHERRGIPLGQPAPDFELRAACDAPASLASLRRAGVPVVLTFLDGGCGSCQELHPHLQRWQVTLSERVAIAVIMSGGAEAARALCTDYGVQNVLVDDSDEPLWRAYRMPGTPSAVAVASDGRVASAAVRGPDALEELVRQTIRGGLQTSEAWKQPSPVA